MEGFPEVPNFSDPWEGVRIIAARCYNKDYHQVSSQSELKKLGGLQEKIDFLKAVDLRYGTDMGSLFKLHKRRKVQHIYEVINYVSVNAPRK